MFCCFREMQRSEPCPKIAHSCFQLKCFAVLGGCNILISGHRMSQKHAFLLSEKRFCRFGGMQSTILAKNGPKLHNYLCGCPFLGHSYFQLKCFAVSGGCNIMCIFMTCAHAQMHDTIYAHKKMKKISLPNLANIIILLSFCYHLENALLHTRKVGIIHHATHANGKSLLLKFAKYYHCVIIVINNIQQENAPGGAFF